MNHVDTCTNGIITMDAAQPRVNVSCPFYVHESAAPETYYAEIAARKGDMP